MFSIFKLTFENSELTFDVVENVDSMFLTFFYINSILF